ncbi:MAG: hypothetical protein M1838_000226 [Thelocarpon superellum]|nr:MAG: hypothetical protein M1838_000226 [Thelocarpon superellum]
MRNLPLVLGLLAALVSGAPIADDNCDIQWVMVNPDGSPAAASSSSAVSSAPGSSSSDAPAGDSATPTGTEAAAAAIGTSPSAPGPGFTQLSCASGTLSPVGPASFPINGDNWCAPTPLDPVPEGAAIYTPPDGINFDTLAFEAWGEQQKANKLPSKFLKIKPGLYTYNLGPVHPANSDTNTFPGTNIVIQFYDGGWTLDLRGVTFVIQITPENLDRRPGQMLYINQSPGFTILGGTFWIDQGEQWTYARMSAVDGTTVTFQVPEGYNRTAWRQSHHGCWGFDDSDPTHISRPDPGQYNGATWDFSRLESDGILSTDSLGAIELNRHTVVGYNLGLGESTVGGSILPVIGTENNSNFTVKGMTTNGDFAQYGLVGSATPATLIDCWIVQQPPRPGFAPPLQGPAGTLGDYSGINFNQGGHPNFVFQNSWWQTSANPHDLQPMSQSKYKDGTFA